MSNKIRRLEHLEEIVGTLQAIIEKEDEIILVFSNTTRVAIVDNPKLKNHLNLKTGKRIAVMRTGLDEKPYVVREAEVDR